MRSSTGADRARARSPSMRVSLTALIGAILIPAALAFSLLVFDLDRRDGQAREQQLMSTARVLAVAVDADLGRGWALLDGLAKSPSIARHDWAAFDQEARRMAPPDTAFLLAAVDGAPLVNTRVPFGAPLPKAPEATFKQRWSQIQTTGRHLSDLFVGRVVNRPTLAMDVLVRENGKPAYILSMLLEPVVEARLLAQQKQRTGWITGLLDSQAVQIARNPRVPWLVGQPATPDLAQRIRAGEEGVMLSVSRFGDRMVVAFARSRGSGWTAVVAEPRAEFEGPGQRSLWLAFGLSSLLLLLGVILAFGMSQRLVRGMRVLADQARAVGEGRPAPAAATGVAEADEVSVALESAASERAAREAELAGLNATLEARVAEATERLVQTQKMEALGQLSGGFAHDFNNLLTAILGNLHLLKRTRLDERQERYVTGAQTASERGAKLTGQLLAFGRRQRLKPEPLDLNEQIKRVRDLLPSTLGDGVRLALRLAEPPVVALADRTQLELAVLNLAINGRDAMPEGGVLTIATGCADIGVSASEGAPPPGRYAVVEVIDAGEGMDEEVLSRAFEPFFTTKGPSRGSGLGLPQVLGMARQLGGGVEIKSARGEGTTVRLLLPLAEEAAVAPTPQKPSAGPLDLRVLLVDDDEAVRSVTAGMLQALGCVVAEAESGQAALALLTPDLEIVIADYAMPGLNGADLAGLIAQRRADLPVMLITGYADPSRLAWRGAILAKPFDLEGLAASVRRAVLGDEAPPAGSRPQRDATR